MLRGRVACHTLEPQDGSGPTGAFDLRGMTANHANAIKAGAPRKEIEHDKKCLANVFGDLDYSEG